MALRSGLAAQIGFAAETTYGVRAVPDHFYELVSETMKLNRSRTVAKGIRPNKLLDRAQRFRTTKVDVSGDVSLEVNSNSFGLLFKHMLGTAAQAADGAGFKRTYTLGDIYGQSLTCQVGTPSQDGTVNVYEYTGCKVDQWEIATAVDQVLSLKLSLDGTAETSNQTLATASYPVATYNEVYYVDQCALSVGGTTFKSMDLTITGNNNIKTDRFYVGSQNKLEQLRDQYASITGTLTLLDWTNAIYSLYAADTTAQASCQIIITATGSKSYDTAKPNKIVITIPSVRFDGETPDVSGPNVIELKMPFTVLDDDTNTPITIEYYTRDSAD